ncbi:zinc-binding dehydrogenase [bacterium]|nr:zinc-binding dehydrogenase [bacterium]
MTERMNVIQIVEPGRAEVAERPVPEPQTGQALIKVFGVTTCPHWDMHIMAGEPMFPGGKLEYPYTPGQPGHEATGEVEAVGPETAGVQVGDSVSLWRDQGPKRPGFYAQYAIADAANLIQVPEDLTEEATAPTELAMCVHVSIDQLLSISRVTGTRFGVGGLGPAGLIAIQMAKAYGASEVVAFDPVASRRELALSMGADRALEPTSDAFPDDRFSDGALDVSIDCTGLPVSIEFLMDRTRDSVALFGVLREEVRFTMNHWRRALKLIGYDAHNRSAAERAVQLIRADKLDLKPLTSARLPFSRYAEGVEMLKEKKAIKILYDPWMDG